MITLRVLIGLALILVLIPGCVAHQEYSQSRASLIRSCQAWEARIATATDARMARHYGDAAADCWSGVADSDARMEASRRRLVFTPPEPVPFRAPVFSDYQRPVIATPEPMPIPGVGAQTPPRGPMTWGETPFAVPPIMRDVPVEEFPWLAH